MTVLGRDILKKENSVQKISEKEQTTLEKIIRKNKIWKGKCENTVMNKETGRTKNKSGNGKAEQG